MGPPGRPCPVKSSLLPVGAIQTLRSGDKRGSSAPWSATQEQVVDDGAGGVELRGEDPGRGTFICETGQNKPRVKTMLNLGYMLDPDLDPDLDPVLPRYLFARRAA